MPRNNEIGTADQRKPRCPEEAKKIGRAMKTEVNSLKVDDLSEALKSTAIDTVVGPPRWGPMFALPRDCVRA